MNPVTKERLLQAAEALGYAVVATMLAAAGDVIVENPAHIDWHHVWEVARAAGLAAGALYFKTKVRLPEAHADRHAD